jgi:outer membrane lipoprotein-sorting protein
MTATLRRLALASIVLVSSVAAAAEPAIIAKARAFVGTEQALNAVTSVHFTGTLLAPDHADPTKQSQSKIEIIFQKPDQQRVTSTAPAVIETTALDGYEGWMQLQDPTDPKKRRLMVLRPEQVKRLRANTWESLAFFRGLDTQGGSIEEQGTQKIDDITCQKVAFIHGSNIIFTRYFDIATGRLVLTETEGGGTIREKGEMIVNGVRFPRSIETTTKNAKGEANTVTITFEKIELNQQFPATLFRVPATAGG